MNMRQLKKKNKKCSYPIVDEFNLITMNEEERINAFKEYEKYCHKYRCYYHYKDKNNRKIGFYALPIGDEFNKGMREYFEGMYKRGRKYGY